MPLDLLAVTVLKALAELAFLFLLGQGALWILAGRKREGNLVYQVFKALTRPVLRGTRLVTPRAIIDRHIPYVALMLLFWIWLGCVLALAQLCAPGGYDCRSLRQPEARAVPFGPLVTNDFNKWSEHIVEERLIVAGVSQSSS